jgi:hypothetical protein
MLRDRTEHVARSRRARCLIPPSALCIASMNAAAEFGPQRLARAFNAVMSESGLNHVRINRVETTAANEEVTRHAIDTIVIAMFS